VQEKKSNMNIVKTFINYCKACYEELAHKTTWPTRKELTQSAVLVLTASLIIAAVVWVMDVLFKAIMSSIYTI
jgi:preprotein translocase subunit SecE